MGEYFFTFARSGSKAKSDPDLCEQYTSPPTTQKKEEVPALFPYARYLAKLYSPIQCMLSCKAIFAILINQELIGSRFAAVCHRDTELTTEETNHPVTNVPVYPKDFDWVKIRALWWPGHEGN
ncbi:hypothetical protein AVEN_208729-1 [Araneus ventricosus]|uniref:Uncharacterized protein n=1 Tax=Araneus ventricosus TaxID=182803 RepID=A0A4Y2RMW5_ARAVE|nr:hypothetical protein AVEN_208729-1 [Araneus ventricosus]